MKQKFIV